MGEWGMHEQFQLVHKDGADGRRKDVRGQPDERPATVAEVLQRGRRAMEVDGLLRQPFLDGVAFRGNVRHPKFKLRQPGYPITGYWPIDAASCTRIRWRNASFWKMYM